MNGEHEHLNHQVTNSPSHQLSESVLDECHQVDELRVRLGAGLRALEHDRAERTGGDDRVRAGGAQLLEPDVADPRAGLFFLVGEEQSAAGAAAERVVAVALGLLDVGAEARQRRAGLVDSSGVASEIAGIVEGDDFTLG